MNKEELLEQQEKLQREMDKLKELIEQVDNKKRWRAEVNDEPYFFITDHGDTNYYIEHHDKTDNFLYSIGNYFKTEKEAKRYRENLVIYQALKDLALELNKGKKIDWNDHCYKYSICYSSMSNILALENTSCVQEPNVVYCYDNDFLDIAKERIGEDNLIQLIKYGV